MWYNTPVGHYGLGGRMFLKQTRYKNGRTFLSITEGFRVNGKTKTRTVESCGYLDVLEMQYEDPVAHFKERARELTESAKRDNEPVVLEFYPHEKIDMRQANTKNIGHAVLSYYYHMLALDRFWNNRRMRKDFKYDPNAIFRYLVYLRVIAPGSKAQAYKDKGVLIDHTDFSIDDMYRCLSFFATYERSLVAWVDSAIGKCRQRSTQAIYYDVTNYYFEIEKEDGEGDGEKAKGLRKRGVSKEHRPNPIVQMGLLQDAEGIPLDYMLFEGNTNDCLTLLPVLKDMKARHKAERMIVVADKGLNTSDNIAANVLDGNGFVFSQSVHNATSELRAWVLDTKGYKGDGDFCIKERCGKKAVYMTGPDGKKKKVDIDVRQVAFWSRDFAEHSRAERSCVIEKSAAHVRRNGIGAAKAHTALRYVNDIAVVADTGECANHVLELDFEKIRRDEEMDGYYCLVTNEFDRPASEILDIYRELWRIEETFRITKFILETRPVYVSRHDRIHAHFLICYVALVLLRLIQADLSWEHSVQEIVDDMASMNGTLMKKNYYLFGHRTHLSDRLGALCGIDLSLKTLSSKDIRDILAKTKKGWHSTT
jgi:hypothetical protein